MSSSFINIRKIKELTQKKINGLTDQTPINELEDLVKIVQLSGGGHLSADSDGDLPTTGMIAFDKQYDRFFYNKKAPKFRNDSTRPGGTVSDRATRITQGARRIDRGRRRRTSWTRKLYGRVNPTGPTPINVTTYQGSSYGYRYGGDPSANNNFIQTYPYASDANSTNVGTLSPHPVTQGNTGGAGASDGYSIGGNPTPVVQGDIIKIPYANGTPVAGIDTGDAFPVYLRQGHTESLGNRSYIYVSGGANPSSGTGWNSIFKFADGSTGTFTDVGDLANTVRLSATASSSTHGYNSGSSTPPGPPYMRNNIQKFSFASDGNATDVGDLLTRKYGPAGTSSTDNGYVLGGWKDPGNTVENVIQKFPFASDANSSDVGDLTEEVGYGSTSSSTTHGYLAGGWKQSATPGVNTPTNVIQKHAFATDANATDVGDTISSPSSQAGSSQH